MKKKILWFSNTPCGAAAHLGLKVSIGGWLTALESEIVKDPSIELHVSFYWAAPLAPFFYSGVWYHPVLRRGFGSKILSAYRRIFPLCDDAAELMRLRAVVEIIQPDLIHVHGSEDNFGLIASQCNCPVIISIQGVLGPYSGSFFHGVPLTACIANESLLDFALAKSQWLRQRDMRIRGIRERTILRQSSMLLGRTNWDFRVCKAIAPNVPYRHSGEILRSSFFDFKWDAPQDASIISVMSSNLYKGLETIVRGSRMLSENKVIIPWKIVGISGRESVVGIVKRWLKCDYDALGIVFLGNKNENGVVREMLGSSLYCQVSHIENSPNSLCEAQMLGMPVIASSAGGSNSLIDDANTGLLFPPGDHHAMVGSILHCLENPELMSFLSNNARKVARMRHAPQRIGVELLEIYSAAIRHGDPCG